MPAMMTQPPLSPSHRGRYALSHLLLLLGFLTGLSLTQGCEQSDPDTVPEKTLVIYSGITMVKPIQALADIFESRHPGVSVRIKQGASEYLYNTLKIEQKGDLYFPGSHSYRLAFAQEGFFENHALVGYNRVAMVVAGGNPKQLSNDLTHLTDPDLSVVLSSPESGAIGRNVKSVLDRVGLTEQVYRNVTYFTTDSHRLSSAIKRGHADLALNWYATTLWPENQSDIEGMLLPEEVAPKKRLELIRLSFAQEPALANAFMQLATSREGIETFHRFGFLTDDERQAHLSALSSQKGTP
jgi:molybdate transport system substrate-binding protein